MYYDVTYKTPMGIVGTHIAVKADNEQHATVLSPEMLAYGTPWTPDKFTVLEVKESTQSPVKEN